MFVDFIGVAMDQLFNQAAKMHYMFGGKAKVPMVLRMPQGAGVGAAAQHSQSLEAWFMHIPGIKVCIPSTPGRRQGLAHQRHPRRQPRDLFGAQNPLRRGRRSGRRPV